MSVFNLILCLSIWTETVYTRNQYQPFRGPDQIYFKDDGPQITENYNSRRTDQSNVVIERQVIERFEERRNRTPVITEQSLNMHNFNKVIVSKPNFNTPPDSYVQSSVTHNINKTNSFGSLDEPKSQNEIKNISRFLTLFGLKLLQNVETGGNNVVMSPYSVATVLALLQQGALGKTRQQITMGLQMTPDVSIEAFKVYSDILKSRTSQNILKVANSIFIADAFDLNPAFKNVARRYFDSDVTKIRFSRSQQAVKSINSWVSSQTNNKIEELLSPDSVDGNTQMVLVNAVYFKGSWLVRFKPELTAPNQFHLSDGSTKSVSFMRMRQPVKAGVDKNNNARIIVLPFEGNEYSLLMVLPSQVSNLDTLLSSLTETQLNNYSQLTPKDIIIQIPKFSVRSDTGLNSILRKMGLTKIFEEPSELSGLGSYNSYPPRVSSAIHTAMLAIDEQGGTASAATAFAVVALSYDDPTSMIIFNRPFLAVLWDNELSLPLFMAKIENP